MKHESDFVEAKRWKWTYCILVWYPCCVPGWLCCRSWTRPWRGVPGTRVCWRVEVARLTDTFASGTVTLASVWTASTPSHRCVSRSSLSVCLRSSHFAQISSLFIAVYPQMMCKVNRYGEQQWSYFCRSSVWLGRPQLRNISRWYSSFSSRSTIYLKTLVAH